ncbi:MAG: arylsulfatase, partial [Verrucomicrobiota bacterium]
STSSAATKPNLIFVLADDLGYGDLGCFGSKHIQTPNLDRMAKEGMILTDFYAGSTVCAPSRCVLMTGLHTGHCWTRGNANNHPKQTLQPGEITVASELKKAGYTSGLFGKWGLGELDSTGHPMKQGFDAFYGYLNQRHAHNFYPEFIIEGFKKVRLRNENAPEWNALKKAKNFPDDGAGWAAPDKKIDYIPDLVADKAFTWIDANKDKPFFLYWALNVPHANNEGTRGTGNGQEIPDYGIYAEKDWPDPDKGQAAMITRMDRDMGRLFKKLEEHGIDDRTLVIFSSDNGHHREGGNNPEFFDANGPLRGMKRHLTEGGIRVPTLARWPGRIKPGTRSNHPSYFGDLLATACDLAGRSCPEGRDSISFLPALTGSGQQEKHPYLYWEFYEAGSKQAVRFGDWKAIRKPMFDGKIELYNLADDLGEENNLAKTHPEKVATAIQLMEEAHVADPNWHVRKRKKK